MPGPADLEDDEDGGEDHRRRGEASRAAEDPGADEDRKEGEDEDEMPRLRRGGSADAGGQERGHRDAYRTERQCACLAA